ncbi:ABC transporter permease [Bacillus kwashiorkori]|uniref:ABC transporter permease n=1 Tax=Bacillus kwashiorkori TaxID=1522318 RepID=UPI0007857C57|nr:ABC transporter permease [Bacillus kwashiorkori]
MNIVNKVTLRNLQQNKRRTLVTIIGVIISVAMITAVSTLVASFMDLMQRQAIENNGNWHVLYKNVNHDQLEAIKKDKNTKAVIISRDIGYAVLEGSKNEYKPYLFFKEYDHAGFSHYPINLIEGRLPLSADEVVISEHIKSNGGVLLKVGDALNIEIGERIMKENGETINLDQSWNLQVNDGKSIEEIINKRKRTLTIVGVIERPNFEAFWSPGYTVLSFVDESSLTKEDSFNVAVEWNKVKRSLFDQTEIFAEQNNIAEFSFNHELLRYYGVIRDDNLNGVLLSIGAILMLVIMIGSISLIYNAFAISVSERSRYLGMLSSIGATKKQKRDSVFFEGFVIGGISIPLGVIAGITGIGITLTYINHFFQNAMDTELRLKLTITPVSIIIAVLLSALTIFISTYIPAKRASKITAIDAIRQSKDVKLTSRAVKTSKLVRKIFGIEAEIGLKNLKRNKRRYQTTVFSLVISIVLFLTVSYFTNSLQKSFELTQFGEDQDITVRFDKVEDGKIRNNNENIEKIVSLQEITEYSLMEDGSFQTEIDESLIPKTYDGQIHQLENGKFEFYINLHGLDDKTLHNYAKQIGMDMGKLNGQGQDSYPAILINVNKYQDSNRGKYIEEKSLMNIEEGHKLIIRKQNYETNETKEIGTLKIAQITDQYLMGIYQQNYPGNIHMIVSEKTFNELIEKNNLERHSDFLYLKSSDPMKTEDDIKALGLTGYSVYNSYKSKESDRNFAMMLSVFIYGFIALITAITISNIFNTISTSIALRKREFAMLKSVGMTPKGFNKMINYESIFYGLKSLIYGLPISIIVIYLEYRSFQGSFVYQFELPWLSLAIVIIGVFLIVGTAMAYSSAKIKKENIIDALKEENI